MWGHGLRSRQQRGPLLPGGRAQVVQVLLRRYLCRGCGAVLQVAPRGVLAHKHFSASAIVLALWLFGMQGLSAAQVRQRMSPWAVVGVSAQDSWRTLKRWLRAQQRGQLFLRVRPAPAHFTGRQVAQRVATTAMSLAPPGTWSLGPQERAFWGGAHMA